MIEIQIPAIATPNPDGNLALLPVEKARTNPRLATFAVREGAGWRDITAAEFSAAVDALAKGFIAAGLVPGDRLGLMCKTRYEWTLVDFAAWTAGLVVVPVYETSSPDQLRWIMADSGAKALVVETARHFSEATEVHPELPELKDIWQIDAGALDELVRIGSDVSDEVLEEHRRHANGESVATIIYTSGTTGRPKGCVLTHANFLELSANAADRLAEIVRADGASTLLFLPLAHVFARFIEVLCLETGSKLGHTADIKTLTADFGTYHPSFVLSVPRVFEKIYNSAEQKAMADGKGRIFSAAADCAVAYSQSLDTGGPGWMLKIQRAIYDKLLYGKLRALMGGRCSYAISGGAPLSPHINHFFRGIGLEVLEGYGLTETTAPVGVNTPEAIKIGTIGQPLPGNAVRIADDGEILVKGIAVFKEYFNNPQATADAFEDGWFKTGDLGALDREGYLRITGRKKEILVTAGGKNVAPAQLEDVIRTSPVVSQCIVVGDRRPFVGALVTIDPEMIDAYAKAHHLKDLTVESAKDHPAIHAEVQRVIDEANKTVSKAESIRKFVVLDTDFTEANGYLTPSLKLKRNVVMQDFSDNVEALYAGAKGD